MKILQIICLMILVCNCSFAGDKILNGGNVIVCKNDAKQITSVELLDFYEARMNGKQLRFPIGNITWKNHLAALLDSWAMVAPLRTKQYSQWLSTFEQESAMISGITIPPIPDTGSIFIPIGCYMEPAGFQRNDDELFPGVKRYVINKDLWDHMDEIQKAGLVLHELIYREAIPMNHPSTFPTRFLVGLLTTGLPDNETYFRTISQMPLLYGEYFGIKAETSKLDCVDSDGTGVGRCKYVQAISFDSSGSPVEFKGTVGPWADVNIDTINIRNIQEESKDFWFRFENGVITSMDSLSDTLYADIIFTKNNFSNVSGFNIELKFSSFREFGTYGGGNESELRFYVGSREKPPYMSITTKTNLIEASCNGDLTIYKNPDVPLTCSGGHLFVYPKRSYYTLNNGYVVRNISEISWAYDENSTVFYNEIKTDKGYWRKTGNSWNYTSFK